jgi:hypothetical protein
LSSLSESFLRRILVCSALVAIVILTARSAIGPFRLWAFHTSVNSPFVAENVFWIAIFGLLCFSHPSVIARPSGETAAAGFPGIHLTIVLCVIALAFVHNLADPFLSDDYIILSGPSFDWKTLFVALHRPGGDGSFRPLGTMYYQFVKAFAGVNPVKWHLVGLGFHLVNSWLVFVIAWRLWRDKTAATIASLVFGLHGTRPEAALWTAGNCDLLACACVLGGIGLALSPRTPGRQLRLIGSLLLVAAGILCKESAYAVPLIAFWMIWLRRPDRELQTFAIGSTAVCAVLFAWRWRLFQGPGGYVNPATGQPAILSLHPLPAAKAVFLRMWDILLVPMNWDAPGSWWLPFAVAASMGGLLLLAAPSGARNGAARRTRLCLVAATCCAVLPAIHLALIGQSEMGSRILYLPGAPFALLMGSLALSAGRRTIVISVVMLAGIAGILEHNLSAWHEVALQARILCRNAATEPVQPVSGAVDGVFFFQNGFSECVAAARDKK